MFRQPGRLVSVRPEGFVRCRNDGG